MAPRVAVLHHRRSFFPLELYYQVGDAAELLWVLDEELASDVELMRLVRRLGVVATLPRHDLEAAARALGRYRPEGIVAFVDDNLVWAAELAERLSLPYHTPEVANVLFDKRRQRAALSASGVPGPAWWALPSSASPGDVAVVRASASYPLVAKPSSGSGSAGIELVRSPADLDAYLDRHGLAGGYLFESYLADVEPPGPGLASYFSVESVVCNGRGSHVALTGRFPLAPPFRESGNFLPALVPPQMRDEALAIVDASIDALGIDSAVIHTELKPTPTGLALVEVNGRLGGRPPFVLNSVSDVNLFRATFDLAVGRRVTFRGQVPCDGVGFWLMVQPPVEAVAVRAVAGVDAVANLPGVESVTVLRTPGEPVDWRLGTDARVAVVRGRLADHEALLATVEEIRRRLVVTYLTVDDSGAAELVDVSAEPIPLGSEGAFGLGALGA